MPRFELTQRHKTVAIVAPGWSLDREQCLILKEFDIFSIAIGNSYILFPEADIFYHADERWWVHHRDKVPCGKPLVSLGFHTRRKGKEVFQTCEHLGVDYVEQSPKFYGIDTLPGFVVMGTNSGYQALNLAVHARPRNILMVGFDLKKDPRHGENFNKSHFDGDHPPGVYRASPFENFTQWFTSANEPLAALGIRVYNCNYNSALECFPKVGLEECLSKLK